MEHWFGIKFEFDLAAVPDYLPPFGFAQPTAFYYVPSGPQLFLQYGYILPILHWPHSTIFTQAE